MSVIFFTQEKITVKGKYALMRIEQDESVGPLYDRHVFRSTNGKTWEKLEILSDSSSGSVVAFHTDTGGHYVVSKSIAAGPLAGK